MTTATKPRVPSADQLNTPWGTAQQITEYTPEVHFVSTAGHGGFRVRGETKNRLMAAHQGWSTFAEDGWYEEDCDASVVVLLLPELFPAEDVQRAARFILAYNNGYFSDRITAVAKATFVG